MSERGFFSASNDIKTLDGNIFSGFPWLTTHLYLWKGGYADVRLRTPGVFFQPFSVCS